jgi:dipeptidyl-peptidase-4
MRSFILLSSLAALASAGLAAGQSATPMKHTPLDTSYLRDHAETRGFMLGRPVAAKPTPDGKAVLFLRAQARVPKLRLYEFDVATGQTRELLTPEQVLKGVEEHLSPEEKARRERMRVSVGGFTSFQLSEDGTRILVSLSGKLYLVERAGDRVRELPTGPGTLLDPKFGPDGKSVCYVRDHDVCVLDLTTQQERRVTTGGTAQRTHGLAEFVAQEEMGRFSGTWWSPDGRAIAYEEADATPVEVWYVADPARPGQAPQPSSYPRPGKANVDVRLGVVPVTGGATTWVQWDVHAYPYLATVRWDKHGPLLLLVQTRDQKEVVLLRADPETGTTTPLLTERDSAWVNLHQDVPRWLEDGSGFLWTSERDGGPQLELRDPKGDLVRVLVPPSAGYDGLVDVDAKGGHVVYQASTDPTQTHLFRVSLHGGPPEALTHEPGVHGAAFAKNHAVYVLTAALPDAMPRTTVHRADGTQVGEVHSVAEEPPFRPRAELLKVGDGPGFHAAVIRPRDFDAHKRYPVLVDVYGGPKHLKVTAAMHTRLLDQWLADQGFIVVSLDNRGTPGRGHDWERAIRDHFGSVPLDDQVLGLQALGRRFPEMDLERVGIEGWSFGGYLSALAVLRRPDVYKAAVAGAPVVDWLDYDTHYTERYLGLPDTEAEAYREGSLLTYAADLKRPLLLIHGTADDNVYFRHTLKLADALFRAGKEFELLPLSGLTHMVPDAVVTQRLWGRIARHFQEHLGRPTERTAPASRP